MLPIWMRLLVDAACTVAFLCPQSGPNHSRDDFPLRISRSFLRPLCWSLAEARRQPFTSALRHTANCSEDATSYPSALELATESVSSRLAWACRALFSYLVLEF